MQLRPYQIDAITAINADWHSGLTDVLLVAATGAGKTNIFLTIAMRYLDEHPGARVLVLAHRQELIEQPKERIATIDPAWLMRDNDLRPRVGIVMAERDDCDRSLVIATVQSLASAKRRARLLAHGGIDLLITDECHHATAPTYMKVYEELKAANPTMLHLGVTATPIRGDGDGLVRVYQKDSAKITIADLVRDGYLVQPRWLGIKVGVSIKGVTNSGGDFNQKQLAQIMDTPTGRDVVVRSYRQYATGRRAIAFTASVNGAHDLAAEFNAVGIAAAAVDGTTPKDQRSAILGRFKRGEIQVLCNCQVLTEGFDAPGTSCILMCRPTRSDGAYAQMMGRGLRPAMGVAQPGEDCLIIDLIPEDARNIVMAGDVLGLPKNVTRDALKNTEDAEDGEVQGGFTFDGYHFRTDGTPLEIIARELDYLQSSAHRWYRRDGHMVLGLGEGGQYERILVITPCDTDGNQSLVGLFRMVRIDEEGNKSRERWQSQVLHTSDQLDHLTARAELVIEKWASGTLAQKDRAWHKQPISDKQAEFLRKASRKGEFPIERMSRGEAACALDFCTARRIMQKDGRWAA